MGPDLCFEYDETVDPKVDDRKYHMFALAAGGSVAQYESTRPNMVKALLGGLENMDPQVRLTCIHMLRRMNPDASMWDKVNSIYEKELETVQFGSADDYYYEYIDIDGRLQDKNPFDQLDLLRKFIIRDIKVSEIKKAGSEVLASMSYDDFATLNGRIDFEPLQHIPFIHTAQVEKNMLHRGCRYKASPIFTPADVDAIIKGIDNENFYVQRETARYLLDLYEVDDTDAAGSLIINDGVKGKIRTAIRKAEANDVVVQEIEVLEEGVPIDGRAVIRIRTEFAKDYEPGDLYRINKNIPDPLRKY